MPKHISLLENSMPNSYSVKTVRLIDILHKVRLKTLNFKYINDSVRLNTITSFLNEFAYNQISFPDIFLNNDNTILSNKNFMPQIFDILNNDISNVSFDFIKSAFVKTTANQEEHIVFAGTLFFAKNFFILKNKNLPNVNEEMIEIATQIFQNIINYNIVVYSNQSMSPLKFELLAKNSK